MFIVLLFLSGLGKIQSHVQAPMHHHVSKRAHLLKEPEVLDIQAVERSFVQRRIQYLAGLFIIQNQVHSALTQYRQEVADWGQKHQYHDIYNGTAYKLDYEYNQGEGFGSENDNAMKHAHTMNDYQAVLNRIAINLIHLHAMEMDYADKTPSDQPHASDLRLMHYHHLSGLVVVVSFVEQACRVYQNGKLVNAFLITSGRFGDPSPAGIWQISRRRWHTVFKSRVPVGSPNWYPDTPINYAMEYRTGGYYLHDSWWRAYYGRGTNFPHYDPAGEEFAGTGSHGCINLSLGDAAWLYANTGYGTTVLTY